MDDNDNGGEEVKVRHNADPGVFKVANIMIFPAPMVVTNADGTTHSYTIIDGTP